MRNVRRELTAAARLTETELPPYADVGTFRVDFDAAEQVLGGALQIDGDWVRVSRTPADWDDPQIARTLDALGFVKNLAAAFRDTRREAFASLAADYLDIWMDRYPADGPWGRKGPTGRDTQLTVSFRVGNQRGPGLSEALAIFADSEAFGDTRLSRAVESLAAQVDWLDANLPETINWRIAAADCLIVSALRLRFLERADAWLTKGLAVVNDAYHRQFGADGSHYEHTPNYHTWMTYLMTGYWRLGRNRPDLETAMQTEQIARMWDYALSTTRPNGTFCGINDCQSRTTGPYGLAHNSFDVAGQRRAFRAEAGRADEPPPMSAFFPDAGQAFFRTGWHERAASVTFDATRWGGGHCHFSRNAVELHAFGRTLLADPSVGGYANPLHPYLRSTRAHSTCNLNGLNQAPLDPAHTTCYAAPGYDYAASDFEGGYWDGACGFGQGTMRGGILASHGRLALWVHDRALFVFDSMARVPSSADERDTDIPSLECVWQFAPGATVDATEQGRRLVVRYGDAGLLMLAAHVPEGTRLSMHEGEHDPARGWVCENGSPRPAPQARFVKDAMHSLAEEFVTVLVPFEGDVPPSLSADVTRAEGERMSILRLWSEETGEVDEIHWMYRAIMMLGRREAFDTDAGLVHLRRDAAGRITRMAAAGATYLRPCDRATRNHPTMMAWS